MVPIQWSGGPRAVQAKMKSPIGRHGAVYNKNHNLDSY